MKKIEGKETRNERLQRVAAQRVATIAKIKKNNAEKGVLTVIVTETGGEWGNSWVPCEGYKEIYGRAEFLNYAIQEKMGMTDAQWDDVSWEDSETLSSQREEIQEEIKKASKKVICVDEKGRIIYTKWISSTKVEEIARNERISCEHEARKTMEAREDADASIVAAEKVQQDRISLETM